MMRTRLASTSTSHQHQSSNFNYLSSAFSALAHEPKMVSLSNYTSLHTKRQKTRCIMDSAHEILAFDLVNFLVVR